MSPMNVFTINRHTMQTKTKSILEEITTIVPKKDKHLMVEGLAVQALARISNLIRIIETSYPEHQAQDLTRRLQLAVKNGDPKKFTRGVRIIKENENK